MHENKLKPLGQPEVDVTELNDGENLAFTAEVDVRPEIDLPDYDGLEVEVDGAEVDRRGGRRAGRALRARFATLTDVERPAADGDFVAGRPVGRAEGEEVEDAEATGTVATRSAAAELDGPRRGRHRAVAGDEHARSPPGWWPASTRARTSTSR